MMVVPTPLAPLVVEKDILERQRVPLKIALLMHGQLDGAGRRLCGHLGTMLAERMVVPSRRRLVLS